MLFFSGARDSLCDLNLLYPVLEKLQRADLVVVEGGGHSFRLLKRAAMPGVRSSAACCGRQPDG